jgi:hypothetical protein
VDGEGKRDKHREALRRGNDNLFDKNNLLILE